jgi:hypothetical protein
MGQKIWWKNKARQEKMTERNPYHVPAGSPEGGQFTTGKIVSGLVYHGTNLSAARKIENEGLKRHKASIGDRPSSVYFMKNKDDLYDYVVDSYIENEEGFAIIEFHIPDSFSNKILEDEEEGIDSCFRIEMDVPKEWIQNIFYYNSAGNLFDKVSINSLGHSIIAYSSVGFIMNKSDKSVGTVLAAARKAAEI